MSGLVACPKTKIYGRESETSFYPTVLPKGHARCDQAIGGLLSIVAKHHNLKMSRNTAVEYIAPSDELASAVKESVQGSKEAAQKYGGKGSILKTIQPTKVAEATQRLLQQVR